MRRHRELLNAYGVSDVKAYMTQFYPEIKREIRESWRRLFVEGIPENLEAYYGNIWEVKKEWLGYRSYDNALYSPGRSGG